MVILTVYINTAQPTSPLSALLFIYCRQLQVNDFVRYGVGEMAKW